MRLEYRVLLVLTVAYLIGTVLYLPWTLTFGDGSTKVAYALVFNPPTRGYLHDWSIVTIPIQSRSVAIGQLLEEWSLLLLVIPLSLMSGKKSPPPAGKPERPSE